MLPRAAARPTSSPAAAAGAPAPPACMHTMHCRGECRRHTPGVAAHAYMHVAVTRAHHEAFASNVHGASEDGCRGNRRERLHGSDDCRVGGEQVRDSKRDRGAHARERCRESHRGHGEHLSHVRKRLHAATHCTWRACMRANSTSVSASNAGTRRKKSVKPGGPGDAAAAQASIASLRNVRSPAGECTRARI
jgi:hypothetical protein